MLKTITLSLIFMTSQAFGQASLDDAYKDGLNIAQSHMQKPVDGINNLNPSEAFKDPVSGKSYYTAEPPQMIHYQEVTQNDVPALEDAGRDGIDKNEATKEAWNSFGKPKIKIDPNELWLAKSNDIIKNAADITTATSSKPNEVVKNGIVAGVNCKEAKVCRIDLIKKTCNEEANVLKKICEKVPNIKIVYEPYQETQTYSGSITQADNNSGTFTVPVSGTITSFSASFLSYNVYRCYNNYVGYLQGAVISTYYPGKCEKSPWVHNRLSFSNSSLNVAVSAGASIKLSFSGDAFGHWYSSHYDLVIKIDRKRKVANLESWSETNCSES